MAKVSETTGQLCEPIKRNRVAEMRSSGISQVAKHTRQIEEKNSELRELKVELDKERMEKQFLAEENSQVKNERRRLEVDKSDLLIRVRDLTDGCRSHDNSVVDSELSSQYHTLLKEH